MVKQNVITHFVKLIFSGDIPFRPLNLLALVSTASISAFLDVGGLALLIVLIQKSIANEVLLSANGWSLDHVLLLLSLIYMVKALLHVLIHKYMINNVFSVNEVISLNAYESMGSQLLKYKSSLTTSALLHELNSVIFTLSNGILLPFISLLAEAIVLIGLLCLIVWFYPWLSLVMVAVLLPFAMLIWWYNQRFVKAQSRKLDKVQRSLFQSTLEFINGHNELRLNHLMQAHSLSFTALTKSYYDIRKRFSVYHSQLPFRIMEFLAVICLFALLYFGPGENDRLFTITVFGGAAFRIIPSVNRIIGSHGSMQVNAYVLDFVKSKRTQSEQERESVIVEYDLSEGLKISNLAFTYPGKSHDVFSKLNAVVKPGQILGISGPSGSGKSTLMHLLAGLNFASDGVILAGKNELRPEHIQAYYPLVAYVEQKAYIKDANILVNVGFSDHYAQIDRKKVYQALEDSDLLSWVRSLPEGIYTSVGEGGAKMSGGQMKRLVLARALYKGASLFLLDEISSALDEQSEKEVMKTVMHLRDRGKMIVIASHNPAILARCDSVLAI